MASTVLFVGDSFARGYGGGRAQRPFASLTDREVEGKVRPHDGGRTPRDALYDGLVVPALEPPSSA